MKVIDGAVSYDGGYNYVISSAPSDGIAVSVYFDRTVTSSVSRYNWPLWMIVPSTEAREKKSLGGSENRIIFNPGFYKLMPFSSLTILVLAFFFFSKPDLSALPHPFLPLRASRLPLTAK